MDQILFSVTFQISRHSSKKNEKKPGINRRTNKAFVMKTSRAKYVENEMIERLQIQKLKKRIETIDCDVNAKFIFYFPETVFFTKKGKRNEKLPDLSNLYELPQDVMQKIGIIRNDTLVISHDGSFRAPVKGDKYYLSIELSKREVNDEVVEVI